jgi:hypothetical protein
MHGHVQHSQPYPSGVAPRTYEFGGVQGRNNLVAVPETTLGTTTPDVNGLQANACLATPPSFHIDAARHAGGNNHTDVDATPAHLDPPALRNHPQSVAAAPQANTSDAVHVEEDPPPVDAPDAATREPSEQRIGARGTHGLGDTQDMHDDEGDAAQPDPLTFRMPALRAHGGSVAQGRAGMSSFSSLAGTLGAGTLSGSDAGHDSFGVWPKPSQQMVVSPGDGTTQDPGVGMASVQGDGGEIVGGSGAEQPEWGGDMEEHVENIGSHRNDSNNHTASALTQGGSVCRSLARLAEIIKQDRLPQEAGGASLAGGSAVNHVETINMRAAGDRLEDVMQMVEDEDGEFADDDLECLATPPDQRPETFFHDGSQMF